MFRNAIVGIAAMALLGGLLGLLLLVGSLVMSWMRAVPPTGHAVTQPAPTAASAEFVTERVQLFSKGYRLEGCIVRPNLTGRLAAIVYNHGSEKDPPPCGPPELTSTYVGAGMIFFAFQRQGHGASEGPYIRDLQKQINRRLPIGPARYREIILLHEDYNADVTEAVRYLLARPDVDPNRVVMTGISFGGIQTLLSAEKGLGVRAFIVFAPGAQTWFNPLLRERLARATRNARAPIFLAQAQNDFSTGPIRVLGPIVEAKGSPSRAILYPAFGKTPQQGHGGFAVRGGIPVWRNDGSTFLTAVLHSCRSKLICRFRGADACVGHQLWSTSFGFKSQQKGLAPRRPLNRLNAARMGI